MKTRRIKSAIPIYGAAAVWLLMGIICPRMLLKFWFLILTAALSAGAYFGCSRLFPGREVTNSGDRSVDELIEQGKAQLENLRAANDAIADEDISRNLDRMTKAGGAIFDALARDPKQLFAVRKFMKYYLPTADKLMQSYRLMLNTESPSENMTSAMESVRRSLGMIADAFEKQLDNLYADRALDIETDIDVLEKLMSADGLLQNGGLRQTESEENVGAQVGGH